MSNLIKISTSQQKKIDRRESKREIITLQTILRSKALQDTQRNEFTASIETLQKRLDSLDSTLDREELAYRVRFLNENKGMFDIFNTFWLIFLGKKYI